MEDKTTSLKRIGEFTVTDRPLKDTKESLDDNLQSISTIFHLSDEWIDKLPPNAKLLNVGSGVKRIFEKQIREKRADVLTVSVDPTLAIDFRNDSKGWNIEEYDNGRNLIYKHGDKPVTEESGGLIPENHDSYQKERIASVTEMPGSVAALAPALPFQANSIDVFFDTFGPSRYPEDNEKTKEYLERLHDILKIGGTGFMNFIDPIKLAYLESFPDLNIDVIEATDLAINGTPTTYNTIKITKSSPEEK